MLLTGESLSTYLDRCSVEISDIIPVSKETNLIGGSHNSEIKAVSSDRQKTEVEQAFDGHKF